MASASSILGKLSAQDRATLEAHKRRVEEIRISTKIGKHVKETVAEREKRKKYLLEDYNRFCMYYFQEYCTAPLADFHKKFAKRLREKKRLFSVNVWPRAHAKSINGSVMAPIWLMLLGETRFVVLISANEDMAKVLLSDIQAQLEGNDLLKADYGNLVGEGTWSAKQFTSSLGCRFMAFGVMEGIRGLRNGAVRPDLIILDDVDTDERCNNPDLIKKLYKKLMSAVYGTFNPKQSLAARWVVLGNLISYDSVLYCMMNHAKAEVSRVDAWDEEGNLAWPENYSREDYEAMIEEYDDWYASQREMFNNPQKEGNEYKDDWFTYTKRIDYADYDVIVGYTDPSFKHGPRNDFKAFVVLGKKGSKYHILEVRIGRVAISIMVSWHYDIHAKISPFKPVFFYMESNFIQGELFKHFDEEAEKRKYHVPISGDDRKKPEKLQRICMNSPLWQKRHIQIDEEIENQKDTKLLISQYMGIGKGSRMADDGPDAVEGAIFQADLLTKKQEAPVWVNSPRGRGRGSRNSDF